MLITCLALAQLLAPAPASEPPGFTLLVCPTAEGNPRNTEGSIVELKDGRLLLAYSHFYGGAQDHGSARIAGKVSSDGGRTWGEAFTVQENTGRQNVMSVSLLRLASGRIGLFYLVKNGDDDLKLMMRTSSDEAKTWSETVCATPEDGYNIVNNDRVVQLYGGRLVAPVSYSPDIHKNGHLTIFCFLSDDEGKTWRKGASTLDLPKRGAMEPGVVQRADGSLLMVIRTQLGRIYTSTSADRGDHWTPAEPSDIASPESPATIKRVPKSGDLLLVWNNNTSGGADHGGRRTPLTAAISRDGGKTWGKPRDLETDPARTFAYTSIAFVGKNVLLTYYDSPGWEPLALRFRSVPLKWFYGDKGLGSRE